jgi:hypothetical protein
MNPEEESRDSIQAMAVKKGDLVRAIREKLENSLEAQASDSRFPPYLFETKGEIVDMRGDYALVKFGQVPTPNIWLRVDQLESVK